MTAADDASGTDPEASLAELVDVLSTLLDAAHITGRVDLDKAGDPRLTLINCNRMPFSLNRKEATAWLAAEGIEAAVDNDDGGNLVISPHGKRAVDRLVELLLEPYMRAESIRDRLRESLRLHQLPVDVFVEDPDSLVLVILESADFGTTVELCSLLGAEDISAGLKLYRPRGMRKLASRMGLLLTGAVGSGVRAGVEPGCAHRDHELNVDLTLHQGMKLAERLTVDRARPDREEDTAPEAPVKAPARTAAP